MPDLNAPEYYAARAAKALVFAKSATDPAIAQIHQRMAASYLELAKLTQEKERPKLHIV